MLKPDISEAVTLTKTDSQPENWLLGQLLKDFVWIGHIE